MINMTSTTWSNHNYYEANFQNAYGSETTNCMQNQQFASGWDHSSAYWTSADNAGTAASGSGMAYCYSNNASSGQTFQQQYHYQDQQCWNYEDQAYSNEDAR
jgi:hypothetical protein